MNGDEEKFEEFLRGFEPRRPRPLPLATGISHDWRRLAAAAVIVIVTGASLRLGYRSPLTKHAGEHPASAQNPNGAVKVLPVMSSTAMTRAVLESSDQFDAQMNDIAARTLPRFSHADSSLRALAKE
jgi:hypothetical protein